jgi:undecaprenyl-diphosphatase
MFSDHRWAVAGAVAMYAVVAALMTIMAIDAARDAVQPVDDWWHDLMVDIELGPLTFTGEALDRFGGGWVLWPLRLAVMAWLAWRTRWAALTTFTVAVVGSDIAIGVIKGLYERARPLDSLVGTSGFAFPSGHAIATAVTAVALVIVLVKPGTHRRVWEVRAAAFAFVMAMSRTYLRAHWLTDVVAGTLLGAATALAVAAVVQQWRVRRAQRMEAAGVPG